MSLRDVITSTRDATSIAAGGFIETPNQRLPVAHAASVKNAANLGAMAISGPGGVRRLGDIATVTEGFPPPIGDGIINDGPGLLLIVEKQPEGNTLQVTHDVEAALDALFAGVPMADASRYPRAQ